MDWNGFVKILNLWIKGFKGRRCPCIQIIFLGKRKFRIFERGKFEKFREGAISNFIQFRFDADPFTQLRETARNVNLGFADTSPL